ncbi:hybrid sensor histidine kinase/response regulator [Vibrio cidicii]|uniref:histidine kinase n=1 Tax=Vibrio cidicii TaxID=1763883 RepID=A0A151L116_9VIBR|nr:ATP-binding protein [Vibrio cidicii]KYN90015.1 hybrid sensor histidine kinase/response regulator [Vibrio cidicii]
MTHKIENTFIQEELQEALAELKESREREKRLAEENKAILSAISAMSEAKNRHEIFSGLKRVLKKYIDFDDFVVLSRHCEEPSFSTLLTTNRVFAHIAWSEGDKFNRALGGDCILLFEPYKSDEFRNINSFIQTHIGSVLLTGIDAEVTQSVILLIGNQQGQFSIESKETLKRFLPLVERAVIDIEHKEKLQRIVEARTHELAMAREESERANKAKSEFLAVMSHELRTPLNSVLGMLDLLKDSSISRYQGDVIQQIESSAELLLALISDILDISKIESGNFSLLEQWTNLSDTATSVLRQQQQLAESKGLSFHFNLHFDPHKEYWLDPIRISQILFNLVGNAVKFTQTGEIHIRLSIEKNKLTLVVKDTGIGIEEDKISSLFVAFKQADSSITRKFGGTGLGLAITKHLVELMSGTISVSSEFGKGSEFLVCLPVKELRRNKGDNTARAYSFNKGLNILVVEDTKSNQMVIKLLLSKLGHKVFMANNGSEAINFIEKNEVPLDMVLMDVSMPVMDGLTATRTLRSNGFQVPIVALTAHALESDRQNCLGAGMDSFIAKPVRIHELENVIQTLRNTEP